ncbi:tail fiber domain-containing protein [Streptococcus oralis subsp. tigurinus]|uniref:tail fiber domain-containing protein n=1 Tax=Streptococcus oralis TaxID=1303 RepID=UPI0039C0B386
MDIFRRKKFDEAMFAKNRTLAIRVGQYQSSDIKEASFDYGYIKGDTYKPGGTCAGSAKIVFTSIITTFNKLDKIYPEIGLLIDGTYEWVKMGEYFINDIEIDRNRKTTKLDLMDGMFKFNREHITDLTYPAEIRQVIKEICLKTGVELANENMDIASMNYVIENIPKDKKMTFRDVLSLASQMLGMSCFFNREGKLEIKELTDSGITITADSYFMHGLTKSEVEYQIAGIICKKDKELLTVGMRTGRSLELDNLFMSQSILDNLYHKIKDIRYYPFNLNYQGHLLLNVGEWVTIKTNTGEAFKSPVLSQSFTFKGGLRGRISADSKAGNDAQYSYAGTLTKKIEQFSEFEKQIQNQIEEADKGFDKKVEKIKNDFNDQVELAKAKVEEVKRQLSDTIDQRLNSFDNGPLQEVKRRADEALRNVGASSLLAQEAKQISEQVRRQLDNKADLVEFQRVKETNQLYERIIGSNENDISNKVARMALTNQLFQVEVSKATKGGRNLFLNSLFKRDLYQRYSTYHVDDRIEQTQGQLALSIDANTKFRGANTLKIVSTYNGKPNNQKVTFRTGGDMRLNTADEMRNKSVRFSFWAKSTVNNTNFQARAGYRNTVEGVSLTTDWKFYDIQLTKSENSNASNEVIMHVFTAATVWIAFPKVEIGTVSTDFSEAPEDTDEAIRSVQSQLAGSFAFQNLTSAGSIVSQINATNNQILIEAEKIRLKGKTLLDELTAINGYFKRLFVGEGTFAKLNAEIIGSKTITADKLIMDQAMARMFVSSDIFTDTLAAKEAFINKLRSVVVSATLLEGYKGKIGGFQIGTHDKDPHTYWLTGQNQFAVGMSNGSGDWSQTALWVNWGNDWGRPSNTAWFVKHTGQMFCYNRAHFWNDPTVYGDLIVTGNIKYYPEGKILGGAHAYWLYSGSYKKVDSSNGYMYFYAKGDNYYDWIPMNKEISDRRYKHNIKASTVSGLDIVESLKTYSYRKEYDGKIEDIACGIMAQDVQKYVPEAFYENPDGAYSYRTFELVPYLIKAIQELNQKIQKLEKTA